MEQETASDPVSNDSPLPGPTLSDRVARLHREITQSYEAILRQRAEFEGARARLGEWDAAVSGLRARTEAARDSFEKPAEPDPPPAPVCEPTAYRLPEPETIITSAEPLGTQARIATPQARSHNPPHLIAYMMLLAAAGLSGPLEFSSRHAEAFAPKVLGGVIGDTTKVVSPVVSPTRAPERFPAPPPSALEEERGREALGLVYSWVPAGGTRAVLELLADAGGAAWDDPDVERLDRDIYQVTLPKPFDQTQSEEGGWTFQVNVASGLVLPSPGTARLLGQGR